MNDPMTILKSDHREVMKLLAALGDSDEGSEREAMVGELQAALSLHMQIEEQIVYPLVAEHVGEEDAEEAGVEHTLTRDGLEKATAMVSAPGFGAVIEMLRAGLKHHVDEEEREIMPELKSALDREAWRELGDRVAAAKADAGDDRPARPSRRSAKRPARQRT